MNIDEILKEKEGLLLEKEINLVRIDELDEKIKECRRQCSHYSIRCFFNNHNLEMYRRKKFVLEKGLGFSFAKITSLVYEKIRIVLLEGENRSLEDSRMYYVNKISDYKFEKKKLEKDNILLSNKIFIIDHELKKDLVYPEKVLVKEENK